MATIGLSKPYYGVYSNIGNTVTYSNGGVMGKAVEMNIDPETTEDSNLYADNGVAESERAFSGGSGSITTDHLTMEVYKALWGASEGEDGEIVFDDNQQVPYLGIGFIVKGKFNNELVWRSVILPKVMFSIPSDAAVTQGESIEWQTPELPFTIMKDDTATHVWKRIKDFKTEAEADSHIRTFLGGITVPGATA